MRSASCAATLNERLEPLPGDDLVPDAVVCATHAICIEASAERVWPWLAQMGAGRGGWYSHDWIDLGGGRSADHLLPRVKELAVGDVLPAVPDTGEGFGVASVDPPRELVLVWPSPGRGAATASWAFVLHASPAGDRTRLLVRARLSRAVLRQPAPSGSARTLVERISRLLAHLPAPVMRAMASLGHDFMETRQLRGIKRRVEAARG